MKERIFLIAMIGLLLAINAFTLVRFYKLKQQYLIAKTISPLISDELRVYKTNSTAGILNSNLQLDKVMATDTLNMSIPLKGVLDIGQEQVLVCRFSQMHCESCVNATIQIIRKWANSVGQKNLLFMGNYRNNLIFSRTIPSYGIQASKVYNVPTLNIPAEELGFPYLFVLDGDLRISNLFVPDKGLPSLTIQYLNDIQKRFGANGLK